jgi:hypothetical protein
MSEVTAGWKCVAIVTESEPFSLLGQNPWNANWLPAPEPLVTVAHPSHPAQRYQMQVYDLESTRSIRFAAGEFSNGVWGFYVPAASPSA